jgi:hypothetical protein
MRSAEKTAPVAEAGAAVTAFEQLLAHLALERRRAVIEGWSWRLAARLKLR